MSRVFSEHVVIKGNLFVNKNATILKDLTVKGTISFIDLVLTGKLIVEGNAFFKKNITVDGVSNLKGKVIMSSNLILNGNLKLDGTFITSTAEEINYLSGATSNVQDQLDSLKSGNITIETNDNDSDYLVVFNDDGTIYDSSNLTYNPSTQTLTATTFNGNLTGDVTGDVTGNVTTVSVKWSQIDDDIEDDEQDQTGHSISLSDDGNRLAVAANKYDSGKGRVKVYEYDGTSWNKLGDNIDSAVNVSLSGDGNFMVIGDPNKENDDEDASAGRVRVFEYDGTSWTKIGDNINGEAADDESGRSVSLNYFGSIVAIGAPYNDNDNGDNSGLVKVYEFDGTTWTLLGDNINGEAADDESGRSVSLSYNGYIVAIGAPQINTSGDNPGYVSVYEYDTNTAAWNKLGNNIEGKDNGDYSGSSVSLSSDGYIVAIGSPQNNTGNDVDGTNPGYVSVYEYDSNTAAWTLLGDEIKGEGEGDYSGYRVSLRRDG